MMRARGMSYETCYEWKGSKLIIRWQPEYLNKLLRFE